MTSLPSAEWMQKVRKWYGLFLASWLQFRGRLARMFFFLGNLRASSTPNYVFQVTFVLLPGVISELKLAER